MKKNLHYIIVVGMLALSFTTASMLSNPNAPRGYTGAPTAGGTTGAKYCTNCHGDFTLNTAGGNVTATGLPSGTYTAGTVYNFSITITHSAANRTRWGFAIKAVNTVNNNVVGTFSTTNTNASVKGTTNTIELSHAAAPSVASSKTYTFSNLKWTAPTTPIANETNIKFYIVGVAGDASGNESGDYVYSTTVAATLGSVPVTMSSFIVNCTNQNNVLVQWKTEQEINTSYFEVQRSTDGFTWNSIATINAKGNTSSTSNYGINDIAADGKNYYRIKMVDFNGAENYSSISTIIIKSKAISVICRSAMPLKAGSVSQYDINADLAQDVNIIMSDMNGKILYHTTKKLTAGQNTIELANPVQKGIYAIKFVTKEFEKTLNQIVQ
jgi:hypothetical protein